MEPTYLVSEYIDFDKGRRRRRDYRLEQLLWPHIFCWTLRTKHEAYRVEDSQMIDERNVLEVGCQVNNKNCFPEHRNREALPDRLPGQRHAGQKPA